MAANHSLEEIIALISRTLAEFETRAVEQSSFANLSMKQIYYLETIKQLNEPALTALAETWQVSKPSVTAIIAKLQKQGYVKKVRSATDRRSYHVVLTAQGQQISELHDALHRQIAAHFTAKLNDEERAQMVALLNKIV